MTAAELEALWTWAPTKAQVRDAVTSVVQRLQQRRQARMAEDYRREHPETTTRDAIVLLLAELESRCKPP
jgi:hypothetical protein